MRRVLRIAQSLTITHERGFTFDAMKERYFDDLKVGDRFKSEPLNVTVREEQRKKLEQMAAFEKRSGSKLVEDMADERWKRLVEQQGIAAITHFQVIQVVLFHCVEGETTFMRYR